MLKVITAPEITSQKNQNTQVIIAENLTKSCSRKNAVSNFTEITCSSTAVLFLIENIEKFYEIAIAGQKRTTIGQVPE